MSIDTGVYDCEYIIVDLPESHWVGLLSLGGLVGRSDIDTLLRITPSFDLYVHIRSEFQHRLQRLCFVRILLITSNCFTCSGHSPRCPLSG